MVAKINSGDSVVLLKDHTTGLFSTLKAGATGKVLERSDGWWSNKCKVDWKGHGVHEVNENDIAKQKGSFW